MYLRIYIYLFVYCCHLLCSVFHENSRFRIALGHFLLALTQEIYIPLKVNYMKVFG